MDSVDDTRAQLGAPKSGSVLSDEFSLLTLVVDTHPDGWIAAGVDLCEVVTSLLVLLNAHIALNSLNQIAVLGYNSNGARWIHPGGPPSETDRSQTPKLEGNMYRQFQVVDENVVAAIRAQLQEPPQNKTHSSISGALSLALCYSDRFMRNRPQTIRGRLLVVTAGASAPARYISTMNTIFAAQKLRVPVDVCNFGEHCSTTTFLQQAAEFTGGAYLDIQPDQVSGLVQTLLSAFSADPQLRDYINLATAPDVDFSAVCFATSKVVEIGYVCSVCLCIMEALPASGACPVCHTHYEHLPGHNSAVQASS